jgi:predicted amidohydrolase YtcJ
LSKNKVAAAALCRMITLGGAEAIGINVSQGSMEVEEMANCIALDQHLNQGISAGVTVLKTRFERRQVYIPMFEQSGLWW